MSKPHTPQKHTAPTPAADNHPSHSESRKTTPAAVRQDMTVTPERIRMRAYELYQARTASGTYGCAIDDWYAAERELIGNAPDSLITQEIESKSRSRADMQPA